MDKDGILFFGYDEYSKSRYKIIYNGFTFKELLKGIITEYTDKNEDEAELIVVNSELFSTPIETYEDALFFSHEIEYHWAMIIVYGDMYWQNGISEIPPNNYLEWKLEYIRKKRLKDFIFVFIKY